MIIKTNGLPFEYELEKLTRLFFPFAQIRFAGESPVQDGLFAEVRLIEQPQPLLFATATWHDRVVEKKQEYKPEESLDPDQEKTLERTLAALLFDCYCELTEYQPEWGILTGIRPAKLYRRFAERLGDANATRFFKEEFRVGADKLDLLRQTARSEDAVIARSAPDAVSIYLSVPFCPSRCSYCSFVSHSIDRAADLIPQYVRLLCKEIEQTAEIVKRLGLRVMTVYMGGGTPTTLSAEQLTEVLQTVHRAFGDHFAELTVEAGRPDTITAEKLLALRQCGVDRISINPQTMNDRVLQAVGRRHTVAETVEAFHLARSIGFHHINMDLIAGLPADSLESFQQTIEQVIALDPESVTVHSLSIKRSSGMGQDAGRSFLRDGKEAAEMVRYAERRLGEVGILPYYMYRQSKTVGNLENVGYAKSGYEGLYNVYIMDETHTILACGASAVTKLRAPGDGAIERIFNFKYPYEYIDRFDEMQKRKDRVEEFYHEHTV